MPIISYFPDGASASANQFAITIPSGEITGNWTVNPNYETEEMQFYTDIPVEDMTAMSSAVVTLQGYHEQDDFRAECIEGAIRIYAKLCPISEVKAIVQFGDGDGSAIVLREGIDGVATVQELTYAEYQALETKDPDTMYVVTDVDLLDLPIDEAPTSGSTNAVSSGGVYTALAGKAPAGYGLGGFCTPIDSWENATKNGFYSSTQGLPDGWNGLTFHGIVFDVNDYKILNIWQTGAGDVNVHLFRKYSYIENVWQWGEWEWGNPPMQLGVEYRTTERYLGKPVYVKCINVGTLPNKGLVDAALGVSVTAVPDFKLIAKSSSGDHLVCGSDDYNIGLSAQIVFNKTIRVYAMSVDFSGYTGVAVVKYTKD